MMKKLIVIVSVMALLSLSVFAATTIEQINAYNKAHDLPWLAGVNQFYGLSLAQVKKDLGALPPLHKQPYSGNKHFNLFGKGNYVEGWTTDWNTMTSFWTLLKAPADFTPPASFDLRDVNGVSYVTPVRNQDWQGVCWAFSAVGAFESDLLKQQPLNEYPNVDYSATALNLSEQYIAYHNVNWPIFSSTGFNIMQEDHMSSGGWGWYGLYNSMRYGIPTESDFPFVGEGSPNTEGGGQILFDAQNPNWTKDLLFANGEFYIDGYTPWNEYSSYKEFNNSIKYALMNYGALSVDFHVPVEFDSYATGVIVPATPVKYAGWHAVTLVGWIDNYKAMNGKTYNVWIVKNSWGKDWGMNGYFLVPMATEQEFESHHIADWKIDADWLFGVVFSNKTNWHVADFNGDGKVNAADFNLLKQALLQTNPSSSTIAKYDISDVKDGELNFDDFVSFMKYWNLANGK